MLMVATNNFRFGEHVGDVGTTKMNKWKRRARAQVVSSEVIETSLSLVGTRKRATKEVEGVRNNSGEGLKIKRRNVSGDVLENNCLSVEAVVQPRQSQ
jgi:hypothetical protein